MHRPTTAAAIDSHLRTHAFPTFEARPVASIRPSEVQAWVRGISGQLSLATVRVVVQDLRSIFNAAVRDQVIARSPYVGVKLPANDRPQVQPLETAEVFALIEAPPIGTAGLPCSEPAAASAPVRRSACRPTSLTSCALALGSPAARDAANGRHGRVASEDGLERADDAAARLRDLSAR